VDDYYNLGTFGRVVTTDSAEAQRWFDRGLGWCYAFNRGEAVRCFRQAIEHDDACALAHWGVAYASGAYYNRLWVDFAQEERETVIVTCREEIDAALARMDNATPIEQALIRALHQSFHANALLGEDDFIIWNDIYAAGMRQVYAAYPDDLDVCCLCAEALISRTPWLLWDLHTGQPADGADTLEAIALLERGMALAEAKGVAHPGLPHLYIHTMEMSPHPEKALRAADSLREMITDAGHLLHMPSHIDVLCGHYYEAVVANSRAIAADNKFLQRQGSVDPYTLYRAHDYHFKLYAAMFLGQFRPAIEAADEMIATIPEELLRSFDGHPADSLEGYIPARMHVLVRFGKWDEIVAEPLPADQTLYCVTTAMIHYAKGVAHASSGHIAEAEEAQATFRSACAVVPESRMLFSNKCEDLLVIAEEMLAGEIDYRKGDFDGAFAHLRQAVAMDDALPYAEPWGWMQPVRHALGALLLEQDRVEEAEAVYRADLGLDSTLTRPSQHPDNIWSLHGFVECLHKLGKHAEAAIFQPRLDLAVARADVEISASCYCRIGADDCCD